MEGLTPDEAREVPLSHNPFKRHQEVLGHISDMGLRVVGMGEPFVGVIGGRHTLIRLAEAGERTRHLLDLLPKDEGQDAIDLGKDFLHGEDI